MSFRSGQIILGHTIVSLKHGSIFDSKNFAFLFYNKWRTSEMSERNIYHIGFIHGVDQARHVVELEYKVKTLEHKIKYGLWGMGILGVGMRLTFIFQLPPV